MSFAAFIHAADGPERGRVEITGSVMRTRTKSQLVVAGVYPHLTEIWLPRGHIEMRPRPDGRVDVLMPRWLAEAKGLMPPRRRPQRRRAA